MQAYKLQLLTSTCHSSKSYSKAKYMLFRLKLRENRTMDKAARPKYHINLSIILVVLFSLSIIFLTLRIRSRFLTQGSPIMSADSSMSFHEPKPTDSPTQTCAKISPSLAHALVHYATSNTTPQQTPAEILVSLRVLEKKSPCNFLVFGLGHDSLMWMSLNHNGRTVFLEENKSWIDQIQAQISSVEAYHVVYDTKVTQADELLEIGAKEECRTVSDPRFTKCPLALHGFPNVVYETEWDLIMVDAPTGYHDEAPGRMKAIYTVGLMPRLRKVGETDVFAHDVDRVVEDKFTKAFLCEGYLKAKVGKIRHFTIPSIRKSPENPFCP